MSGGLPMGSIGLAVTAFGVAFGFAWESQPGTADALRKEPAYQTKTPKYGLLRFDDQQWVWIVLDGRTLYVDRNGNGDLTEPGEKVLRSNPEESESDRLSFQVGELNLGGRIHKGLAVFFTPLRYYTSLDRRPDVKAALARDAEGLAASVVLDVEMPGLKGGGLGGRVSFSAGPIDVNGVFELGGTPGKAPAVHFDGPMEITFYSERPTLRVGRTGEFVLIVGICGKGPGTFATIAYDKTIPAAAKPLAVLRVASAKAGAEAIEKTFEIESRC